MPMDMESRLWYLPVIESFQQASVKSLQLRHSYFVLFVTNQISIHLLLTFGSNIYSIHICGRPGQTLELR